MQVVSFRELGAPFYDEDIIEGFIGSVGTMDDALLDDGTYLVAVAEGRIVGSGGWSWRVPGYAVHANAAAASQGVRNAKARSLFVHPHYARRGIARMLMATIESEIAAAGFHTVMLAATLSGIPFYRRLGYRSGEPVTIALPNGRMLATLAMMKTLAGADAVAEAA
jgi:GNAT superfamily N-acetyltransferase